MPSIAPALIRARLARRVCLICEATSRASLCQRHRGAWRYCPRCVRTYPAHEGAQQTKYPSQWCRTCKTETLRVRKAQRTHTQFRQDEARRKALFCHQFALWEAQGVPRTEMAARLGINPATLNSRVRYWIRHPRHKTGS